VQPRVRLRDGDQRGGVRSRRGHVASTWPTCARWAIQVLYPIGIRQATCAKQALASADRATFILSAGMWEIPNPRPHPTNQLGRWQPGHDVAER
jgi:hypothetical protein